MPYMPFMPPMGGAGMGGAGMGGRGGEERERTTWRVEDRPIWTTGSDIAPMVVHSGVVRGDDDNEVAVSVEETETATVPARVRPRTRDTGSQQRGAESSAVAHGR
jgi:hypothetical protein